MPKGLIFFGQELPLFNLFVGASIYFGIRELEVQLKKFGTSSFIKKNFEYLLISLIIGGFISASIFEDLYHSSSISFGKNGITFYGGLLFGIFFIYVLSFFFNFNVLNFFNAAVPSIFLAHAIGRIGCFCAGCCYGIACNKFFCFDDYFSIKRLPVQLLESFLNFIGYLLIRGTKYFNFRFIFYLIYYPLFRFFLEYLRDDNRGSIFFNSFSPSQVISFLFFILGCSLIVKVRLQKL